MIVDKTTVLPITEERGFERLFPALLSAIAGMVDVIGWLSLGGLFTAHITGNLVVMAADLGDGHQMRLAQILAIPMFVLATAVMGILVRLVRLSDVQREDLLMLVQTALLFGAAWLSFVATPSLYPAAFATGAVALLAVSAMASQNALLHLSRTRVPTTAVMTGNIVACTLALVTLLLFPKGAASTARKQWRETWPILLGFLIGCVAGSGSVRLLGDTAWFAAALASLLVGTCGWSLRRRNAVVSLSSE